MSRPDGDRSLLHDVLTSRVYDVARETPLEAAPRLSRRLSAQVLLKREDLQPVFSFKLRGAYNRIANLTAEERARGVITASAGNHAQGVAYSARHLGLKAVIVMPRTTPEIKVEAVESMGAEVVLEGDSYSDAQAHCDRLAVERGLSFVHPFDDPLVIAGQGTIGEEILRQAHGRLDAVFVPVGGGGLLAGDRRLRQGADAAGRGDRRRAVRSRRDVPLARRRRARAPRARRPLRRRRRGAAGRRVHLRLGAARVRRRRPRLERRDLRGDQGRVRRDAQRDGARGRPLRRRVSSSGSRSTPASRSSASSRSSPAPT